MASIYNFVEQHAARLGCDIAWEDDPLFHGRDGDLYFGVEMPDYGSRIYTQAPDQSVEVKRRTSRETHQQAGTR